MLEEEASRGGFDVPVKDVVRQITGLAPGVVTRA